MVISNKIIKGLVKRLQRGKFLDTLSFVSQLFFATLLLFFLLDILYKVQPGWGGRDVLYCGPLTRASRDAVGPPFITDCGEQGSRVFQEIFSLSSGAVIRTICRQ